MKKRHKKTASKHDGHPGRTTGARKATTRRKRTHTSDRSISSLGKDRGYGVWLRLADNTSGSLDEHNTVLKWRVAAYSGKKGGRPREPGSRKPRLSDRMVEVLAAAAHPIRGRILTMLLEGPATYQALKKTTKLEPGPLYFHIHQLRASGVIMPKQRDLYELTRGGRNLILTLLALNPLIRDGRRCPLAS